MKTIIYSFAIAIGALCIVAGWILFMQLVDLYVIVLPMLHQTGISFHYLDLFALCAIGGPLASWGWPAASVSASPKESCIPASITTE